MKEFIEIIESIGFVKSDLRQQWWTLSNKDETKPHWLIEICDSGYGSWHLVTHTINYWESKHTYIPFGDREILNKYFKMELREMKLTELGV